MKGLNNLKLYKLFKERGITHLYHANTVGTALTFIAARGLLSRGAVYNKGLFQTWQSSDRKDKLLSVWHDVFLDTKDLHEHFNRQNHYGPVLFKFSIDFLKTSKMTIWITKDNPIYWNTTAKRSERYFSSLLELRRHWKQYRAQKKMITVRENSRPILFKYLKEVVIDDPQLAIGDIDLLKKSRLVLKRALKKSGINVPITIRTCGSGCHCESNYMDEVSVKDLERLFLKVE